jgi:MFS family permease
VTDLLHPSAEARRARVATAGGFGAQGFGYALLFTSLPALEARLGIDTGVVTVLILGVCVVAALGTLVAGRIAAGRAGSRIALVAGVLTLGVGLIAVAVAPNLASLATALVVVGLGLGLIDTAGNMQAVAVQHAYGTSVLASFHGAFSVAAIIGALLVSVTGDSWPTSPVLVVALLALPVCVAAAALVVLWGWRRPVVDAAPVSDASPDDASPDDATPADATPDAEPHRAAVPWRPVIALGVLLAGFYVVDSSVSSWSTLMLSGPLDASAKVSPLGYAAYQGAVMLARVVGDHSVRRWGRAGVVLAAAGVTAIGLVGVVLAPGPWAAVAGFALAGALGVIPPLAFSTAGDVAPRSSDLVVERLNLFNYAGVVFGAVVVGAVGDAVNLHIAFVVPTVALLLVPLTAWVLRTPGVGAGGARPVAPPVA